MEKEFKKKRIECFNATNLWRKKKTPLAIIPIRTAAEFSSGSLSSTQFTSAINQWMTSAPGFHPGDGRWSQYPTQSSAESRIWVCPSRGGRGQLHGVRARVRLTFNTGAGVRCCVRAPVVGQTLMMSAVTSWSRLSRDQEPLSHGFSRWPTLQGPGSGTQQRYRATLCACVC